MARKIEKALRRLGLEWGPLDNMAHPARNTEGRVHARSWARSVRREKEEMLDITPDEVETVEKLKILESMPTNIAACNLDSVKARVMPPTCRSRYRRAATGSCPHT